MATLDSALLVSFMTHFFGYGALSTPHWFVGMEEGGGHTEREIAQRLARWNELGRGTVIDNARFHEAVQNADGKPMSYFFCEKPKIQRTWAGLIRILIAAQGDTDDSAEAVRTLQTSEWGRSESNNCLLELLPLPSPGTNAWHYDSWTDLPELVSRETYKAKFLHSRARCLKALVNEHKPRSVVFYSMSREYLAAWSEVAGADFSAIEAEEMILGNQGQSFTARFYRGGPTLFIAIYHPVYKGLTTGYFARVGETIRERTA